MGLQDVMLEELRDLYSAENQLVKALPKLAKAAEDTELKQSISNHLQETTGQIDRLKQIFTLLEEKPTGKHCKAMEGLIEEAKEAMDEDEEGEAYDVGLIGAASRVEHYEIAGYTAAIAMARGLGHDEVADLLEETLEEEDTARETLEAKVEQLIAAAAAESEEAEDEEADTADEEDGDAETAPASKPTRSRK